MKKRVVSAHMYKLRTCPKRSFDTLMGLGKLLSDVFCSSSSSLHVERKKRILRQNT